VHAAIRQEGRPALSASTMTASDLAAALQIARELEATRRGTEHTVEMPAAAATAEPEIPEPEIAASDDKNVTPLSSARASKTT
jgi:uncharacterized membrane protein